MLVDQSTLILIACRCTAMFITAPLLAGATMPISYRIVLTVILVGTITINVASTGNPANVLDLPNSCAQELAIGAFLGSGAALILLAAGQAGSLLSMFAGLNWSVELEKSQPLDPTARLLWLTAMALYLIGQGPEALILGVSSSFQEIPLGSQVLSLDNFNALPRLLQQITWLTLQALGPVLVAYYGSVFLLAVIVRILPEFHLFFSGSSLQVFLFWGALLLTLSGGLWTFEVNVQELLQALSPNNTPGSTVP